MPQGSRHEPSNEWRPEARRLTKRRRRLRLFSARTLQICSRQGRRFRPPLTGEAAHSLSRLSVSFFL
jgi:hypothetical protein